MMKTMTTRLSFALAIGCLMAGAALAGPLEPPGPPAPTMVTQQQLWDAVKPPGCFNNSPSGLRFVDCGNGTVQDTRTGLMAQYFTEPYPARAAIGVASLPRNAAVEMDAVMVLAS